MANSLRNVSRMRELFDSNNGQFMMVTFVKKDGTLRKMCVQPAAAKYHVAGENASESGKKAAATRAANHPNLINVWDVDRKAFRSINLETVVRIAVNGQEYTTWD